MARLANVTAIKGDVADQSGLAALLKGHDVAISSVRFLGSDPAKLIAAAKASGVGRTIVVGGAGSLEVAPGVQLVTTPNFPPPYKAEAEAGGAFLDLLRRENELNWTFISPSALFVAGERTGKFRLGGDRLLTAADGKSWISFEDYAVALADEIERPAHIRTRFTVGYWRADGGPPAGTDNFACARLWGRRRRAAGSYCVRHPAAI